jgi:hypothetical protein
MAMADPSVTDTPASQPPSNAPDPSSSNGESGPFDEKTPRVDFLTTAQNAGEDEEEDEDMDALIDELESQDGHDEEVEAEREEALPGAGRVVPEDQLLTDTRIGLTDAEVHARRKKYGMNQMKEEKENLILKFLGYFIGPIQFVMEVRPHNSEKLSGPSMLMTMLLVGCRRARCRSPRLGRFWCDLRPPLVERSRRIHPGIPGWIHCR